MNWTAEELYFCSRLRQRLLSSTKLLLCAAPTGPPIVASNLGKKKKVFFPPTPAPSFPSKGGPTEIFTLNRKIISCRVTWALSKTANLYSRQIMILQRKTETYATWSGPPSGPPNTGNLYLFHPSRPPPVMGTGSTSLGKRRQERGTNNLPPSGAKNKNAWTCDSISVYASLVCTRTALRFTANKIKFEFLCHLSLSLVEVNVLCATKWVSY